MNRYENREAKKILFLMALAMVLAALCMGLLTIWQCGRMRERENAAVFALVEQIRQQYPQVDEDTLMQTLNEVFNDDSTSSQRTDDTYDADTAQELRDLRERYGIREDDWAVAAQEPADSAASTLAAEIWVISSAIFSATCSVAAEAEEEQTMDR